MSMRRVGALLMRYSDSPLRYMRRVMVTSVNSSGSVPSELSSTRSTSATPTGCRADDPAKMTSSIACPRSCLADCSPRTHRTASETLDLPEPLGPTTTVTPGSSCITLLSAKDLNPLSVSDLRCTVPLENGRWQRRSRSVETRRKVYHRARLNPPPIGPSGCAAGRASGAPQARRSQPSPRLRAWCGRSPCRAGLRRHQRQR